MGILQKIAGIFADTPVPSIVATQEEDKPLEYESDLHLFGLVTIGEDFKPSDIKRFRESARTGDPRQLYEVFDEMPRLGPGAQKTKAIEAMKSATVQVKTFPEEFDDDDNVPEDADPQAVAGARAARDFLQDALSEWFVDLIGIHAEQDFYGIADSRIRLLPRGNAGRWDSIEDVQPIPARRHRLDTMTHEWLLMPSPNSYSGVPISSVTLRPDRGVEGVFFTEIGAGSVHLDQRGLMMQCLVPWAVEQHTARWRAKAVELYGVPQRIGFVDFSNKSRKASMLKMLKEMGSTAYGLVDRSPANQSEDLKILESSRTGGGNDPFERQLEWCALKYSEIILGHSQANSVQRGAGSKIPAETAQDQFKNLINSRLQTLAAQVRRGLCRTLVTRNLGALIATRHNPVIKFQYTDRDDPEMLATVAKLLKEAGAGGVIASEDLVRRCTLRLAKGEEKSLDGNALSVVAPSVDGEPVATGQDVKVTFNLDRAQAESVMGSTGNRPHPPPQMQAHALSAPEIQGGDIDGAGDEITTPARLLIDRAAAEDWSPNRLLAQLVGLGNSVVDASKLEDRLAGVWASGIEAGVLDVQASRKKKDLN